MARSLELCYAVSESPHRRNPHGDITNRSGPISARTLRERELREAFLTFEASCGANGLVSLLLLATVSRRQGAVAEDLQAASDHAEVLLTLKLRKHQDDALASMQTFLAEGGIVWS